MFTSGVADIEVVWENKYISDKTADKTAAKKGMP